MQTGKRTFSRPLDEGPFSMTHEGEHNEPEVQGKLGKISSQLFAIADVKQIAVLYSTPSWALLQNRVMEQPTLGRDC